MPVLNTMETHLCINNSYSWGNLVHWRECRGTSPCTYPTSRDQPIRHLWVQLRVRIQRHGSRHTVVPPCGPGVDGWSGHL